MENHFFKLSPGADIINSLKKIQNNKPSTFFLMSAVGDLSKVVFKCPLNNKPILIDKKLEIISLNGYIKSEENHIHISVSDENCSVYGGHLLPGSIVLKSLDLLLFVKPNLKHLKTESIKNNPSIVDIYILPNCPWSNKAMKLLDLNEIKYNSHVIQNDEDFEKINNITYHHTFPQIFINNKFIGGYSQLFDLSDSGQL